MIRPHLEKQLLPVQDNEYLTCWENIEFALLTMAEPMFEPILVDAKKRQKEKEDKLIDTRSIAKEIDKYNMVDSEERNEAMQDDWISAMEKEFDRGNMDNLSSLLKRYDENK